MKTFKQFVLSEQEELKVADAMETLMRAPHELKSVGNPISDKLQAIHCLRKYGIEDERIRERLLASGHPADEVADMLDKAGRAGDIEMSGYTKDLQTIEK